MWGTDPFMKERLQTLFWVFCAGLFFVACLFLAGKIWRAKFKAVPTVYVISKPLTNSFIVSGGFVMPITHKNYEIDPSVYIKTNRMETDIQSIRWGLEFGSLTAPEIDQISIFDTNRVWVATSKDGVDEGSLIFRKENGKWNSVKTRR